jgi:hypothetical protein
MMTIAHLDLSVEKELTFYSLLLMRNLDSDSYLTPTQQLFSYIMASTTIKIQQSGPHHHLIEN